MTQTLKALVDIIVQDDIRMGYRPLPPATAEEIGTLRAQVSKAFEYQVADVYYELLTHMDGAYVSELMIAGTRGRPLVYADGQENPHVETMGVIDTIRAAHVAHSFPEHVLTVMEGPFKSAWDARDQMWLLGDNVGYSVFRRYRNFEEALADALWNINRDTRHLMPEAFEFFTIGDAGQQVRGTQPMQRGDKTGA